MINKISSFLRFSLFSLGHFLKEIETFSSCFYRVIETLVKVWENSKKLWKHSPPARVPTVFLVLPNLHSCFYLTNRFKVAVRLFSNRSQMTSKCGKNKKVAHEAQPSVSLMFLPHFDVLCDLLLNRRTATWNLFVLYNKELKYTEKKPFYFKFCHFDRHENSTLT